ILSDAEARALSQHLPGTVRSSDWVSLYSNVRHGSSLTTLLARCAGWQPTLVVIEASVPSPSDFSSSSSGGGDIGGGGSSSNIPPPGQTSGGGGGTSPGGGGETAGVEPGLRVYPWAGSDRCFMTSSDEAGVGLGMGGGGDGGNFGFLLSADLRSGSTGPCDTFGNPSLAS
ncbi:unnamed protein product, partial [Hapterophycus canaliculatus]